MADLTERGQILLIAAFALAVTFVALALVVNSAIYTENLASRGEVAGSSEALLYQHQVTQSVGEAMAFANVYNQSDLTSSLKTSLSDIGRIGGVQQATGGQLVNVSYEDHETGRRIADNESGGGAFESSGGLHGWQLAEDVQRTRQIRLTVTDKSALNSPGPSAFALVANQSDTSGNVWRMELGHDDVDDAAVVDVETAADDTATCEIDVSGVTQFEVDVTRGIVNGKRCHALTRTGTAGTKIWFANGITSPATYNISFENGQWIRGNYSMVTQGGSMNTTTLVSGTDASNPYHTQALYQATIDYLFVTPKVTYEAEVRVAPGEPP